LPHISTCSYRVRNSSTNPYRPQYIVFSPVREKLWCPVGTAASNDTPLNLFLVPVVPVSNFVASHSALFHTSYSRHSFNTLLATQQTNPKVPISSLLKPSARLDLFHLHVCFRSLHTHHFVLSKRPSCAKRQKKKFFFWSSVRPSIATLFCPANSFGSGRSIFHFPLSTPLCNPMIHGEPYLCGDTCPLGD